MHGQLAAHLGQFPLHLSVFFDQRSHCFFQKFRAGTDQISGPFQQAQPFHHEFLCGPAGDGLDPPHPRGRPALADNAEAADLGCILNVCAAAEFHAYGRFALFACGEVVADADHPHFVAVFLAEEGHCPLGHGLFVGGPALAHHIAGQNVRVGRGFDGRQIFPAQGLGVGEIKAQAVGVHHRALLMHPFAQAFAQFGLQNMGGRVVAHDVPAPLAVDLGIGRVADPDGAAEDRAHMADQLGDGPPGVRDLRHPHRLDQIFGEVVDLPRVADLTTAGHIKGGLRQDDLHVVTGLGALHGLAIHDQGQDLRTQAVQIFVDAMGHALLVQFALGTQIRQRLAVDREIRPGLVLGLGPVPLSLLGQHSLEPGHIHAEAVLLGDVSGQVHGEAVGVPQTEGLLGADHLFALGRGVGHQPVQDRQPSVEGAVEALFLGGDGVEDEGLLGGQIRVVAAHLGDHGPGDLGQEGAVKADAFAKAGRPAQQHAGDIAAPLVARQHPVPDQKGDGAGVVGDAPIGDQVGLAFGVAVAGRLLDGVQNVGEAVGVVVVVLALHDAGQAFQARARVHAGPGQIDHLAAGLLLVLHEDQIPDLQIFVVLVDAVGDLLVQIPPIVVDLRAGAAGAHIAHGPPIVLLAKAQHPLRGRAGVDPQLHGLVIVLVDREPEPLHGQPPLVDQQIPGVFDGLFFEIVAKGEVAQHLEEGVVPGAGADLLQIVVLAADPQTLLGCGGPAIVPLLQPQEEILELHHARIGEHQGGVVGRDQVAALDRSVAPLAKIVDPILANFVGGEIYHRSRFPLDVAKFSDAPTQIRRQPGPGRKIDIYAL